MLKNKERFKKMNTKIASEVSTDENHKADQILAAVNPLTLSLKISGSRLTGKARYSVIK